MGRKKDRDSKQEKSIKERQVPSAVVWLPRVSLRWQAKKHGTARAAVFQTIQRDSTSSSSFRRIL